MEEKNSNSGIDKDKLAQELIRKHAQLEQRMKPYLPIYQAVTDLILPRISDWTIDNPAIAKKTGTKLYTSAGKSALRLSRDGLQGYLTPRSAPWFATNIRSNMNGVTRDKLLEMPGVRKYVQDSTEALIAAVNRSNFYDQIGSIMDNGLVIGTSSTFVENDPLRERSIFKVPHPKQVLIAEDEYGVVDTWFIKSWKSGKAILDEYDNKELPETTLRMMKESPFEQHQVIQAIYPRRVRAYESLRADQAPWASIHILVGIQKIIKVSGIRHTPGTSWRYRVNAGEEYGYSPGMDALVDLERLNEVARTDMRYRQLTVEPPVWYPGKLKGQLNLNPRGMNPYTNPAERIEPISLASQYPLGAEQEKILTDAIRDHFNAEFFLMMSMIDQRKTATEVWEIAGEKAAIMGATVGRIESELLDPILSILYEIESSEGRMPDVPDALLEYDAEYMFDYIFPLAMLQERHFGQQSTTQGLSMLAPVFEIFEESKDNISGDVLARALASKMRLEADSIRTPEEVEKIRANRAAIQEEAFQAENAAKTAKAYRDANQAPMPQSPAEAMVSAIGSR